MGWIQRSLTGRLGRWRAALTSADLLAALAWIALLAFWGGIAVHHLNAGRSSHRAAIAPPRSPDLASLKQSPPPSPTPPAANQATPAAVEPGLAVTRSAPPPTEAQVAAAVQAARPGAHIVQQVSVGAAAAGAGAVPTSQVMVYSELPAAHGCVQPELDVFRSDGRGALLPSWQGDQGSADVPPLVPPVGRSAGSCLPTAEQVAIGPLAIGGQPLALLVLALGNDRRRIVVLDPNPSGQQPSLVFDQLTEPGASVTAIQGPPTTLQVVAALHPTTGSTPVDAASVGEGRWHLAWDGEGFRLQSYQAVPNCSDGSVAALVGSAAAGVVLVRCGTPGQYAAVRIDGSTAFAAGSRFDLLRVGDDIRIDGASTGPAALDAATLPLAGTVRSVTAALRLGIVQGNTP